jgi:hypothetical protein
LSIAQVLAARGIRKPVGDGYANGAGATEAVRCLACGTAYDLGEACLRPEPGCPACGNVTWIAASFAPTGQREPRRSGGDRLQTRIG